MRDFYNKALIGFLGLLLASCLVGYLCFDRTFLSAALLPSDTSSLPWNSAVNSDTNQGGASSIKVDDDKFSVSFDFILSHQAKYPNATVELRFKPRKGKPELIDLSRYDHVAFSAKCAPANILMFAVLIFEDKVSVASDPLTYRAPTTFFSCNENWRHIELDLTRLETPQWWFDMFKLELSKKEYKLDKVSKITFGSSFQSPFDVDAKVQLQEIILSGRDWFYLYVLGGFLLVVWGSYAFWFFRQHTRAVISVLRDKIQRDRPLIAYQQLTVEPHRDKDKRALLHFMATNYSNAELSLESMAATIGVSRTKINDILKTELGFTFTGYLNKLRLTEASRLLAEKEDANIAEIAYSVGYKNVSYFNKLFKEEYSCTPKTFKALCDRAPDDS
jgi:AraC-like DNA-binding protein